MIQEVHCNECIALESMSAFLQLLYKNTRYPLIAHFTSTVQMYITVTPTCLPQKRKLFLTPSTITRK
jgi:hypothetical protein